MIADFAARYPVVWHLTEAEGAECEVLYPAATLHRMAGLPSNDANRDEFQRLALPGGRIAVVRMQLMRDERLCPTLAGAFAGRPELWRSLLNQHVFFWVSPDRRERFANACVRLRARSAIGAGDAPAVIEVDTALLLAAHRAAAFFATFNTGSTIWGGARVRRDEQTLRPLHAWRQESVVELAIRGPVPLAPVRTSGSSRPVGRSDQAVRSGLAVVAKTMEP